MVRTLVRNQERRCLSLCRYLDAHVMDGYKFLMDNYRPGDKICLFGEMFALAVRQISLN
jgi:uncharacterized protein (DUF2235 family)